MPVPLASECQVPYFGYVSLWLSTYSRASVCIGMRAGFFKGRQYRCSGLFSGFLPVACYDLSFRCANSALRMSVNSNSSDTPATVKQPAVKRRLPKGEVRKAEIIQAAMTIFARDGYAGASLSNIAKVAGLSQVGLLHHFPTKLVLLQAVLEHRDQYVAARLHDAGQVASLEGFMAFLKQVMSFSIEDASVSQALMIINTESLSVTHPAHRWFSERFQVVHSHLQTHLNVLAQAGEIRQDVDVRQISLEIVAMMDGMQIQWLRSPADVQIDSAFARFLERLAQDLTGR
ncbi:HTH-type transcriptional regulator BetI [Pseudomonas savastanoi pv. phaseolicola]|nr:HTH-type transcriptional regulator BetI [Pseudomonas savastanoi pv. phaseolicola]RMT13930.1 Transcriptional regulator, TetR family [Pseudomonas savastanoi pv. phaseolicola]